VAEANEGREAVELVAKHHPDVAVLDIGMTQLNGIEATRQIVSTEPATQVVILSMHADEGYVLKALKAGARAYILKNSAEADLIRAIRAVAEGKSFFSPVISKMLLEDYVRQIRDKQVEDSYDLGQQTVALAEFGAGISEPVLRLFVGIEDAVECDLTPEG